MLRSQSLEIHESAYACLWNMRKLRVLLLFSGRDAGPFHRSPQKTKKMQVAHFGWGETTRSELSGIINQLNDSVRP